MLSALSPFSPIVISLSCPHYLHPISQHQFMLSPCSHKFVSHNHPSESFSLYLALFCFPSSLHLVPYLLSLSLSFPILFILSPIILSLPVRFLTILSVVRGYFFTLLLLGCTAGLIFYEGILPQNQNFYTPQNRTVSKLVEH